MTWIWILLIVVVLGATAAVAIGRGDSMARAYPDRPDVRLPADRSMSAEDLEDLEFSVVLRGYRMDEVDEVIRRLTSEIADRDDRLARLEGRRRATEPMHQDATGRGAPPIDGTGRGVPPHGGTRRDPMPSDAAGRDAMPRDVAGRDAMPRDVAGRDETLDGDAVSRDGFRPGGAVS